MDVLFAVTPIIFAGCARVLSQAGRSAAMSRSPAVDYENNADADVNPEVEDQEEEDPEEDSSEVDIFIKFKGDVKDEESSQDDVKDEELSQVDAAGAVLVSDSPKRAEVKGVANRRGYAAFTQDEFGMLLSHNAMEIQKMPQITMTYIEKHDVAAMPLGDRWAHGSVVMDGFRNLIQFQLGDVHITAYQPDIAMSMASSERLEVLRAAAERCRSRSPRVAPTTASSSDGAVSSPASQFL